MIDYFCHQNWYLDRELWEWVHLHCFAQDQAGDRALPSGLTFLELLQMIEFPL